MAKSKISTGLILSGAYISSGMVAEFGRLPPSFLPLANRRLYCAQIEGLSHYVQHIMMAIPQSFQMEDFDAEWLNKKNVQICPIEENKNLGEAVYVCLTQLDDKGEDLWLLFGDTLLTKLKDMKKQSVAVGFVQEYSRWGYCHKTPEGTVEFFENYDIEGANHKPVTIGCFRLVKSHLAKCLELTGKDFYAALNLYSSKFSLELVDHGDGWYDFGHINAYFRSRQHFTTQRAFNNISISKRKVCKYGENKKKIAAELAWYETVPRDIDVFLPSYLGRIPTSESGTVGYATEYLFLPPINDLYVYGKLPEYVWVQIITSCGEFLKNCHLYKGDPAIAQEALWLYADKTKERLETFSKLRGISLSEAWRFNKRPMPSLNEILRRVLDLIPKPEGKHISLVHGDFHFANIFFDFRSLGVKVVDPRGIIRDKQIIYGDHRYDIAKLAHSVDGLYDFILAGVVQADLKTSYDVEFPCIEHKHIKAIQELFSKATFNGFSIRSPEIQAISILLFMSMLPLHKEDISRQDTLLANVFRLFHMLEHGTP